MLEDSLLGCFDQSVRELLIQTDVDKGSLDQIDSAYEELAKRQENEVTLGDPKVISERTRAKNNILVLRQGLLHRALNLARATNLLVADGNVHAIALCIRGMLEANAQLGYFCNRLTSLTKDNITFEHFHKGLANTLLAASHPSFEHAPRPINVLTCFEKADRHFEDELGGEKGRGMLRDAYDWLSDYCHPNFLSSASSAVLERERHVLVFQHGKPMLRRDRSLISALAIGLPVFLMFWDDMSGRLPVLDR